MENLKIKPDQMKEAARAVDYLYTHNKNYTKAQEEATTILYFLFFKGVHPYKEENQEPATDPNAEKLQAIAARIFDIMPPWDLDGATVEDVAAETLKNPLDTITFLLDIIDDLQK